MGGVATTTVLPEEQSTYFDMKVPLFFLSFSLSLPRCYLDRMPNEDPSLPPLFFFLGKKKPPILLLSPS